MAPTSKAAKRSHSQIDRRPPLTEATNKSRRSIRSSKAVNLELPPYGEQDIPLLSDSGSQSRLSRVTTASGGGSENLSSGDMPDEDGIDDEESDDKEVLDAVRLTLSMDDIPERNMEDTNIEFTADGERLVILGTPPNNAANKTQLRQRFFDLHFGATSHASPIYVYEVLDITNPKKTALTAAMDTLCVAQLATSFQDENLAATSRILYCQAIHRLNEKLGMVSKQKQLQCGQLDEIVGAINALIPCAWFDCIGAGKSEWMRHTNGLNQIMEMYGWQMLSEGVRDQFYHHWERRAFTNRMLQRKALPSRVLRPHDGRNDKESFFKSCAIPIPGLLERTDALLKRKTAKKLSAAALLDLLTVLGNFVSQIKRWQLEWTSEVPLTYHIVNIQTFKSFLPLCKQHVNVTPTAYWFKNSAIERDLRLSHMCLLNILQAIIDIHTAYANVCIKPEFKPQLAMAKADAKAAAEALCMHVPWSAQPQYMAFACTYSLIPLYHASRYYERNGYQDKLAWCLEVSRSLSERYGISIDFSMEGLD